MRRPRISVALESGNINKCRPRINTAPIWHGACSNNLLKKWVQWYSSFRKPIRNCFPCLWQCSSVLSLGDDTSLSSSPLLTDVYREVPHAFNCVWIHAIDVIQPFPQTSEISIGQIASEIDPHYFKIKKYVTFSCWEFSSNWGREQEFWNSPRQDDVYEYAESYLIVLSSSCMPRTSRAFLAVSG